MVGAVTGAVMVDDWGAVVIGLLGPDVLVACTAAVSTLVLTSRDTVEPPWVDDLWCFFDQLSVEDGRDGALGVVEEFGYSGWAISVSWWSLQRVGLRWANGVR